MSISMTRQRYANIDGLRAIAALGVMVEHLFGDLLRQTPPAAGPMNAVANSVIENFSLGRFGVALFFLISGFVVPFSISGERPLTHFAISRLFRLYPACWLALAALATMAWLAGAPPSATAMLANMTMAPNLFGQAWLSPIYWTLFIELVFYVLVALLFSVNALRNVGVLSILGLALVAGTVLPVQLRAHGVASLPVQYIGMHLSSLFLGLLLRLWLVERVKGAGFAVLALALAQFAGLLAVSDFSLARGDNFVMEGRTPILSAYVLALVAFLAAVKFGHPRSLMLARIGLISYSMYLFHWTVNVVVYRFVPLTGQISDLAVMLICIVLTLIVSLLVYRMVERPMIMFGHTFVPRRGAASRS
jgi:peptidoglycan/LPS O-acetylase OafA/YrhL